MAYVVVNRDGAIVAGSFLNRASAELSIPPSVMHQYKIIPQEVTAMTDAEFQSAVTADIKALVARCVCGAEDLPELQPVDAYRLDARIICDHCGRIFYAPTRTEAIIGWERMSGNVPEDTTRLRADNAALKLALDASVYFALEQDKTSAALLAGVNRVLALLDDEADADMDSSGKYHPNTAMRMAQMIRDEMKGNA